MTTTPNEPSGPGDHSTMTRSPELLVSRRGVHPSVREATPGWVLGVSAGLSWLGAVSTALVFVLAGRMLDGTPLRTGTVLPLVLLAIAAAMFAAGGVLFSDRAASQTERRLRNAMVSRAFDLGVARTAGRAGELLPIATDAVERTAHYRAEFLGPIIGALTTPLLVLGVMAITVDPATAGWLALLVLLVPIIIGGFQSLVRPIGASYRRSRGRLTAGFLEAIQAIDTLVYARAAERTGAELARRGEDHRKQLMRLLAGNQVLILVVDAAFSLAVVVAAAGIVTTRVASDTLTLGEGIAIILMTTLVIGPVDVVGQFFYIGIAGRAAQKRLGKHLGTESSTDLGTGSRTDPSTGSRTDLGTGSRTDLGTGSRTDLGGKPQPAPGAAPADQSHGEGTLALEGVTASWTEGRPVFENVSLRVEPGERVTLVGPSGIGKSTVSALLQAHLLPRAGRVLVDGLDTRVAPPETVRSRIAVVEQRTFLFLGSIADNLRLADPHASDERLWAALEHAELRQEVERMPAGLDTQVGESGRLLSGGQAQRLAIARAWLRNAPILLFDEPTSQVDLAAEASILAALDRLAEGRTVLVIAHRPGAILTADRVIDLSRSEDVL